MAAQALMGADRREPEATLGAVGIATVSAATAALAAALEPPPGSLVAETFYRLTLTGAFLGGSPWSSLQSGWLTTRPPAVPPARMSSAPPSRRSSPPSGYRWWRCSTKPVKCSCTSPCPTASPSAGVDL
uniref:Uncharacterized protein n=1 Tax=Oryza nivara TaxID=4536 RepID=A0A0E0FG46_ORYNI